MKQAYTTASGESILLEKQLGIGGEGEVWTVQGRLEVAKIYHPRIIRPELERKLRAMVANPPVDEMRVKGHVSIAWPTEVLNLGGKFAGFLMPMLEQSPTIFTVYNPLKRKKLCPGFNWKYLFHTALNLSKAIEAIHYKDYVIGDLNESNILVTSSALVSVIDTDSFQVRDTNGQVYHCKVGKEDFTPPELIGASLDKVDRLPEHDYFGLGVLIFRLLMEGYYPFTGVLKQDVPLNEPVQYYCLKKGAFPYVNNPIVTPPLLAPPFNILPRDVRNLFLRCFVAGHKKHQARPSPREWGQVLEKAERNLVVCKSNPEHVYSLHLTQCPWCQREQLKPKVQLQTPLPPVRIPRRSSPVRAVPPPPAPSYPAQPVYTPSALPKVQALPSQVLTRWTGFRKFLARKVPRFTFFRRAIKSVSEGLRRFFRSRGGYINRRIWWLGTRMYTFWGGIAGLGLFLLLYLIYWSPSEVGIISGVLTTGLLYVSLFTIARSLWREGSSLGKTFGSVLFVVGGALAILLGIQVVDWVKEPLWAWKPPEEVLFFDCFLVGVLGGTAYGNYKILSRRKSIALASVTSLLLAVSPFFLIAILSLLGLPLPW